MGVAVPPKPQNRIGTLALAVGHHPHLRGTATHAVVFVALSIGQAVEFAAEINQIAITIFPCVEHGKGFNHVINLDTHEKSSAT